MALRSKKAVTNTKPAVDLENNSFNSCLRFGFTGPWLVTASMRTNQFFCVINYDIGHFSVFMYIYPQ
jgi:hypothetical protein